MDEAEIACKKTVEYGPEDPWCWSNYGDFLARQSGRLADLMSASTLADYLAPFRGALLLAGGASPDVLGDLPAEIRALAPAMAAELDREPSLKPASPDARTN